MRKPSKNLSLLAACAVAFVASGCANSDRGTTATQGESLNRRDTGVGGPGVGGSGVGGSGVGNAGGIGGGGGHGGGGY